MGLEWRVYAYVRNRSTTKAYQRNAWKENLYPHVPIGSISKNKSIIIEIYGEEEFKRLITEDDETSIENETPNLAGYVSIENFDIDILYKCEQTIQKTTLKFSLYKRY